MKAAPVLLGTRRKQRESEDKIDVEDFEEEIELDYDLRKPCDIIIADDTHAVQAFGSSLFLAPQEDILEGTISSKSLTDVLLLS
jgi:hypothetical protein